MTRPLALAFLLAAEASAQPHLVFDRKIGTDWTPGNQWMSFVAISADGLTVAADGNIPGSPPQGLGLWKFPAGEFVRSAAAQPLAISPNFRYLATSSGVIDLAAPKPTVVQPTQPPVYAHAAFDSTGEYAALVVLSKDNNPHNRQIAVMKTAGNSVAARFGARYAASLAFHPNNQILASGHWNNVTLWNPRTGSQLALLTYSQHSDYGTGYQRDGRYIVGLSFSRDGALLAAGSDDGELQIWDVAGRKLLHALHLGYGDVSNPSFSPDGKLLAAGTYADGTVSLVDVVSGAIRSQIKVSMFGCGSVAFSPDGRYLVTPSNGGQLGPKSFDQGGSVRVFRVEN